MTHSRSWSRAILAAEEEEEGELADGKKETARRQSSEGGQRGEHVNAWSSILKPEGTGGTNLRECDMNKKPKKKKIDDGKHKVGGVGG